MILKEVKKYPCKRVCITGGEPFLQEIYCLVQELCKLHFKVHIESNGTLLPKGWNKWDFWLTTSPKRVKDVEDCLRMSDEVKILIGPETLSILEEALRLDNCEKSKLVLQPIFTIYREVYQMNVDQAVKYSLQYDIPISLQIHRLMGIR